MRLRPIIMEVLGFKIRIFEEIFVFSFLKGFFLNKCIYGSGKDNFTFENRYLRNVFFIKAIHNWSHFFFLPRTSVGDVLTDNVIFPIAPGPALVDHCINSSLGRSVRRSIVQLWPDIG